MSDSITPEQLKTEKAVIKALEGAAMTFDLRNVDIEVSSRAVPEGGDDAHFYVRMTTRRADGDALSVITPFDYARVLHALGEPTDARAILASMLAGMPHAPKAIQDAAKTYTESYRSLRTAHVLLAQQAVAWSLVVPPDA